HQERFFHLRPSCNRGGPARAGQNGHQGDDDDARQRVPQVDRRARVFQFVKIADDLVQADTHRRHRTFSVKGWRNHTENDVRAKQLRRKLPKLPGLLKVSASPDPELLTYAATHALIVISHDVNTMPAHAYARLADDQPFAGLFMVWQTAP